VSSESVVMDVVRVGGVIGVDIVGLHVWRSTCANDLTPCLMTQRPFLMPLHEGQSDQVRCDRHYVRKTNFGIGFFVLLLFLIQYCPFKIEC